ncbi:MAG: RimK family alpha-L-glutamate ligase [Candidatus Aenigmatarchaeota archaeon]
MAEKIAILGPREIEIGYTTKRLIEEASKDFKVVLVPAMDVKLKIDRDLDAIFEKKSLSRFDYILPRIDSKRALMAYPVMRFLDYMGVKKPYVAETVQIAHNKFMTLEQMAKHGIRVPETYLTGSKQVAKDVMKRIKMPAVIKLLSGYGGQGVIIAESKEASQTVIDTMKELKQEVLLERFLPNPGEDIRGIVAGDEIIASYKRIAKEGEMRANVHMGGRGVKFNLNKEMEEICFKAAKAIKSKLCAIDMIDGKDGVNVIEVNINPGIQGMEQATGMNVAKKMIDFVKSEIKK